MRDVVGGQVEVASRASRSGNRRQPVRLDRSTIAVDLRDLGGWNIAHAAIHGLMRFRVAEFSARESGLEGRLLAILPATTARYVLEVYRIFDVPVLQTDAVVHGQCLGLRLEPYEDVRFAAELLPRDLDTRLGSARGDFPSKVFITRLASRSITNMSSIERILAREGFVTILPERLSVLDQFRLFWQASEVIGVHGAALALMLPRAARRDQEPPRLVEVFGAGYVVTLYRCLAAGIGADWVGVRGRATSKAVRDLEELRERSWKHRFANALRGWVPGRWLPPDRAWQRSHQLSNFEIDPKTLELAIALSRDPGRPLPERVW